MTLSSAIQTLSAWSRDAYKACTPDFSRTPKAQASRRPKTDTRAAHRALEKVQADTHARLMAEVSGR